MWILDPDSGFDIVTQQKMFVQMEHFDWWQSCKKRKKAGRGSIKTSEISSVDLLDCVM